MLGLVFRTSCAPPRTAFQINLAGTPGFEPRISGLESDGLPLAYAPSIPGACGRTRTYEVVRRLIYSQVLLLLSHTCAIDLRSQIISDFKFEISDSRSVRAKK